MFERCNKQTRVQCRYDNEHNKILIGDIDIFMFCHRDCSGIDKKLWWWKSLLPRLRHYPLYLDYQQWRASLIPLDGLPVLLLDNKRRRKLLWSHPDLWHPTDHGGSLRQWKNNGWACCPDWQSECSVWIEQNELQIPLQNRNFAPLPKHWRRIQVHGWYCNHHSWGVSSSEHQDQSHLLTLHHWHQQDLWGGDCHCCRLGENTHRENINSTAPESGRPNFIKRRVQISLPVAKKVFNIHPKL